MSDDNNGILVVDGTYHDGTMTWACPYTGASMTLVGTFPFDDQGHYHVQCSQGDQQLYLVRSSRRPVCWPDE